MGHSEYTFICGQAWTIWRVAFGFGTRTLDRFMRLLAPSYARLMLVLQLLIRPVLISEQLQNELYRSA